MDLFYQYLHFFFMLNLGITQIENLNVYNNFNYKLNRFVNSN